MDYKIIPYDIDSLDSEIYDEIKNTPEWNGIYKDDPILKMFIYIIKYYISLDLNNINNTFIDFFPNISNSSEVIYKFASFIGLPINGYRSANGSVRFYLDNPYQYQIIIPKGTQIKSVNDIIYTTIENKTIDPGEIEVEVDVIQGVFVNHNYISNGDINQFYSLDYFQDDTQLIVSVDGEEWSRVDNFLDTNSSDKVYKFGFTKNGFYIQFGNGENASIPLNGSNISIELVETKGIKGRIYSKNLLTTLISSIYDINNNIVKVNVTNDNAITNGTDIDNVNLIKKNIPLYFSYNPYLYTREDYENYMKVNNNVLDCKVYAGFEIYPLNNKLWNNIYLMVTLKSGQKLTPSDLTYFNNYLNEKKSLFMVNKVFRDVERLPIETIVGIKLYNSNLTQREINEIKNQIDEIVIKYFDLDLLVSEGKSIYRNINSTDLSTTIINNIPKIKKTNIIFKTVEPIQDINPLDIIYGKKLLYNNIDEDSLYLYVGNTVNLGVFENGFLIVNDEFTGKIEATVIERSGEYVVTVSFVGVSLRDEILTNNVKYPQKTLKIKSNTKNNYDVIINENNLIPVYEIHSINILNQ